jgi:hypothetical protein
VHGACNIRVEVVTELHALGAAEFLVALRRGPSRVLEDDLPLNVRKPKGGLATLRRPLFVQSSKKTTTGSSGLSARHAGANRYFAG